MKFKSIWLSDIHLGTKGCQSDKLLWFLKNFESENLFLVGDIIDFWSLKRKSYWPVEHNTIIQKVLRKARHGTKVIYIPGNHDEGLRQYIGYTFGDIEIHEEYMYSSVNDKKILCLHGDKFDIITQYHKWIAILGDIGYSFLLSLNYYQNKIRNLLGLRQWSLSSYIKHQVKDVVNFISDYEQNLVNEVKHLNIDGILCGHIHKAEIKQIDNITYFNTGDTVESCTAIVETYSGEFHLISFNNFKLDLIKQVEL
jgi:UDP-2,3-diacylglucosamine pyrophosphatase LpxH